MSSTLRSGYTVGIEEELLLVDALTLQLAPVAAAVLAGMSAGEGAAGHEAYAAQIELRSLPSETVESATSALAVLRASAVAAGGTLMGVGVHPTGRLGDAELVAAERYERVEGEARGLLRRTPEAALHVHVGMPDLQAAVKAHNALRRELPLLQGLAANSPWWFGVDSGLASARYALVRAYPGRGIPRALRDAAELEELTAAVLAAAGLDEATLLWGDIRVHPKLGTLEVRELDAQSRLDDVAAIAALIRALAVEAQEAGAGVDPPAEVLSWSAFRASRDGIHATILDGGSQRPLAEIATRVVERVRPLARELGDEDALAGIARILAEGGGADRRRAHALEGARTLLSEIVAETGDVPEAGGDSATRRWLEARGRRDFEALGALTAADATWESPINGTVQGRAAVVEQVRAGFTDTDEFSSAVLAFEARGERAIAIVHNTGTRDGDVLDSQQALLFQEREGRVANVRIVVDDPEAVESFWAD